MNGTALLMLCAVVEASTGIGLLLVPRFLVKLLLDAEIAGTAVSDGCCLLGDGIP